MSEYLAIHYSHRLNWHHWSQIRNINKQRLKKNILNGLANHSKSVYQFVQYRSYYIFGQTIIDKVAISCGLSDKFSYNFDGIDNIKKLVDQKKGGILLSSHVGNFEMSQFIFNELNENNTINFLTRDTENQGIKKYLESVTSKSRIKFILVSDNLSHIFEIEAALSRNEIICMTGDRYIKNSKYKLWWWKYNELKYK